MNTWRLILREISHRKLNFIFGLTSVVGAVACLVWAATLLSAHEIRTEQILDEKHTEVEQSVQEKEAAVEQTGRELEDSMRKITKGLGFNILVLPQEQELKELHTEGTLSATMPEKYVTQLAESKDVVTVNHLLPVITKKIHWKEMNQSVIVTGTQGEVPFLHRDPKKPLLDHVPEGTIVVGHQIHTDHGLKNGDNVTLLGRDFTVTKLNAERGTADDSTVWISLDQAQEMFGMQNQVNGIWALECNCASVDRVAEIREELSRVLPGTQVIEIGPPALARAEARNKAKQVAEEALAAEKEAGTATLERERESRAALFSQREEFAALLVPLVFVGCALGIGFLAFTNVRQRSEEIGILRAIGVRSPQIFWLVLGKALLFGVFGAVIGYLIGFGSGVLLGELPRNISTMRQLFGIDVLVLALVVAPLLALVASWIPALLAARQDPAVVLQQE